MSLLEKWFPAGSFLRKIALWAGTILIAAVLVALLFDNLVMPFITRHSSEFALTDYVGQQYLRVELDLGESGLKGEVASREYSPGKEAGVVLVQFPPAGTKVKKGRLVKFVVSLGQKMIPIPEVSGKSVRQATLDLEAVGLELGEIAWAFSDTLPERVVVFSYPTAGTEIPMGSKVNLMVNRGRSTDFTFVPNLVGLTLPQAVERLQDNSLKVGRLARRVDQDFLPETVLSQSEPEGTEVEVGTEIDLVISDTE